MKETDVKIVAILLNFRCKTVVGNVKTFPRYIQAWPHRATNTFFINCIARIKFFPYPSWFFSIATNAKRNHQQWRTEGKNHATSLFSTEKKKKSCACFLSQDHWLNFNYEPEDPGIQSI